jgi:putative phosphoserine phosphatase/1-acylglycerol-3-phosphate O-acyltransferase
MKASFFDIDGTLVQGLMIHEFPKQLAKKDIFEKKLFKEIENWVRLYLKDKATYRKIAIEIPKLYSKGLKNIKEEVINKEARKFVSFYLKKFIRPYTMDLVKLMKSYGLTIGISGSPIEVVSLVGKLFNFDVTYGSELEIKDGIYTGLIKQNMIIKETKEKVIERFVIENKIDLKKSFGFGDTEQDLSFLSKVGMPIALNPNIELLKVFKKNKWLSFTSKDDVEIKIKKLLTLNNRKEDKYARLT